MNALNIALIVVGPFVAIGIPALAARRTADDVNAAEIAARTGELQVRAAQREHDARGGVR